MKSRIAVFISALLVWILLDWAPDWQRVSAGIAAAAIAAYVAGDMFSVRFDFMNYPKKTAAFLEYAVIFISEMLKANLYVARVVINPRLSLKSGVVKIKISLKSEIAAALLANTVTLASNTLTVDADMAKGVLYVHCMDIRGAETEASARKTVERFERILKRIFEA